MKESIIAKKSFIFALKIIGVYKFLIVEKKEFVLSKQILRSGTSIGANVEEALGGQSKKDFVAKLSVAYKEARETSYWLKLLRESNYLGKDEVSLLLRDTDEILKIIGTIQKTIKKSLTEEPTRNS